MAGNNVIETLEVDVVLNSTKYDKSAQGLLGKNDDLAKSLLGLAKGFSKFFGGLATATGLEKLINDVARANDQIGFLEKQLNLNANTIKNWQGAMTAGGGSAEGATNSFRALTNGINNFIIKGDAGLTPFLNALNVNMFNAQGQIRKTDDIMLDLADTFSKMDSSKAYSIGRDMGFDDGTIGSLIQGRDALKESLAYQQQLYKSSEQDIKNSRELQKNRALLNSQWDSFKTMMGNALIPIFNGFAKVLLRVFETMQKHQPTIQKLFGGLAILLSFSIIPLLTRALAPLLAFIAPFAPFVAVIAAVGVGFLALYDDYKTWAEGGKSLFDWGALKTFMDENTFSAKNLGAAFKDIGKNLLETTIPTLKEYAQVIKKLISGDFAGAGAQASKLLGNFSDNAIGAIAKGTGEKAEDIKGFIGESAYRLTHRGKTYGEYNNFNTTLQRQAQNAGITDPKELAAFTAIVGHETGDGKRLTESSNYSYKGWQRLNEGKVRQRNVKRWMDSHTEADFNKLSNEDKLNIMYEGMNGNRAGEGYKYRGRGGIQLTGRANYEAFAKSINRPDIVNNPDLVASDQNLAAQSAVWFWQNNKRIGQAARNGDIGTARRIVNGGTIGMDDVTKRYNDLQSQLRPSLTNGGNTTNNGGNTNNTVTVNMNGMNINTTSSTLTGVTSDAISNNNAINNLIGVMK